MKRRRGYPSANLLHRGDDFLANQVAQVAQSLDVEGPPATDRRPYVETAGTPDFQALTPRIRRSS